LTSNFASQVLEISVRMNIDANGLLEVEAEESRSGAKVKITIDTKNRKNLLIKINIFFIDLYSL
jgi:molecular chaperone DnaK (HSP70)